jgi:hypothetical protein
MKERPILFSGPMVRAMLVGTKTQTRRVVKHKREQPPEWATYADEVHNIGRTKSNIFRWSEEQTPGQPLKSLRRWPGSDVHDWYAIPSPYGKPGDRLWVRETLKRRDSGEWEYAADHAPVELHADDPRAPSMISWAHHKEGSTCVSIHMPRWASRITLELTAVRVERLQDITEADAAAEGWEKQPERSQDPEVHYDAARDWYADLWDTINGKGSWAENPWVWVVEFRRLP